MNVRKFFTWMAFAPCVFVVSGAIADVPLSQSPYIKQARIDPPTARAKALKACPGTIVSEELEREGGGSGLRYSFDIRNNGVIHEVGIDARSGKVLENSREGPNAD